MKLIPALEYEKLREDSESWNKIILHKDGKFYHLYEWSAWLLKTVVCTEEFQRQRGDDKVFSVNRYKTKEREYVMYGFPIESLSKYVPEYDNLETMEGGDLKVSVTLPIETIGLTAEEMLARFETWKQECTFVEKKDKGRKNIVSGDGQAAVLGRSGIFGILSQVLSYPVERMTPAENIEFISKLKQQVAALL